jgi:hypothetical protein
LKCAQADGLLAAHFDASVPPRAFIDRADAADLASPEQAEKEADPLLAPMKGVRLSTG